MKQGRVSVPRGVDEIAKRGETGKGRVPVGIAFRRARAFNGESSSLLLASVYDVVLDGREAHAARQRREPHLQDTRG